MSLDESAAKTKKEAPFMFWQIINRHFFSTQPTKICITKVLLIFDKNKYTKLIVLTN